jgi:predicted nuclease of restriction endonuclease-like (RecB) superfamily
MTKPEDRLQPQFTEVLTLIQTAQQKVFATANQELIKLYWSIGKYISDRFQNSEWGQKAIEQLAAFIQTQEPGIKGFEKRNLERMRQFYETYPDSEIATALRTQLNWTHHRIIMQNRSRAPLLPPTRRHRTLQHPRTRSPNHQRHL